ncbi:MAG: thioredoxin-disulfide reductase [Chloroflexi bacterium]|nr:thioredoxin-disulfide reductase [Chloroflexota bacterium]
MTHEKIIIIGAGPAGYTAALYAARANLEPLVITGDKPGGQVSITHIVENYPGFPDGIGGPEMVQLFHDQAEKFGTRYSYDLVSSIEVDEGPPYTVKTEIGETYTADALIVTTGASPRLLNIPGEEALTGKGVSYCATCDGFFFKGKDVVVVGGGDSAIEEGLFLTKFASRVRVIHRRDKLRAKPILQERAFDNEKMEFVWDTVVEEIFAGENGVVNGVRVRNVKTDETTRLDTDGVFIFIGHIPNSWPFEGKLEMDDNGYLITDDHMQTNVEGIFAAGEIQDPVWKQVATSVGQGTAAAMAATEYLAAKEHEQKVRRPAAVPGD